MAQPPAAASRAGRAERVARAAAVTAVVVGIVLRARSGSQLWLDEALTVHIAQLPLDEIPGALRRDGSPPLYYVLLHAWMSLVGDSTHAVRALSGLLSTAALPLAWLAGRRVAGRTGAIAALLLLATSPFAVRYATETRMYSLVVLLALGWFLAAARLADRPGAARAAPLALLTGLLLLTHYWSMYAVAVAGAWAVVRAAKGDARARWLLGALVAGGVLFLPWAPVLAHQAAHTGAPWARPTGLEAVLGTVVAWAGGLTTAAGAVLLAVYLALAAVGYGGRATDAGEVSFGPRGRSGGRALVAAFALPLALGIAVARVTGGGFAARYTSIVLVPFVLLLARGVAEAPRTWRVTLLSVAAVAGLAVAAPELTSDHRTQVGAVAAAIAADARPGDVVAVCPDQLAPPLARLLPEHLDPVPFPAADDPRFVDWTDYRERNRAATVAPFAARLSARAGDRTIWLVWADGYRTLERKCGDLADRLAEERRRERVVERSSRYAEEAELDRFAPRR